MLQFFSNASLSRFFYPVLLITLFFGLRPKNFDFRNSVTWLEHAPGIEFKQYGIAYTEPFLELNRMGNLTVEMAIEPKGPDQAEFSHILTLYNGDDQTQLVIGQYKNRVIVMNGDDYEHSQRKKRIVLDKADFGLGETPVRLQFSREGSDVFVGGKLKKKEAGFVPELFNEAGKARIVLGNSIYGQHPWEGVFRKLAISWSDVPGGAAREGSVLYRFTENSGSLVIDRADSGIDLSIPPKMTPIKRKFFQAEIDGNRLTLEQLWDFFINFFGFIPFGLVLSARLARTRAAPALRLIFLVVGAGFLLSLLIETAQVWLPSRSSDAFDLGLNTVGALGGAIGYAYLYKREEVERMGG